MISSSHFGSNVPDHNQQPDFYQERRHEGHPEDPPSPGARLGRFCPW